MNDIAADESSTGRDRRAASPNSANVAVVIVHGVGDPSPGDAVETLARSVVASRDQAGDGSGSVNPSVASRIAQNADSTGHPSVLRGARESRWMKDHNTLEDETFRMRSFVSVQRDATIGARSVRFAEVHWADASRMAQGVLGTLLGLVKLVFDLRHVARDAATPTDAASPAGRQLALAQQALAAAVAGVVRIGLVSVNLVLLGLIATVALLQPVLQWDGVETHASLVACGAAAILAFLSLSLSRSRRFRRFKAVFLGTAIIAGLMLVATWGGLGTPRLSRADADASVGDNARVAASPVGDDDRAEAGAKTRSGYPEPAAVATATALPAGTAAPDGYPSPVDAPVTAAVKTDAAAEGACDVPDEYSGTDDSRIGRYFTTLSWFALGLWSLVAVGMALLIVVSVVRWIVAPDVEKPGVMVSFVAVAVPVGILSILLPTLWFLLLGNLPSTLSSPLFESTISRSSAWYGFSWFSAFLILATFLIVWSYRTIVVHSRRARSDEQSSTSQSTAPPASGQADAAPPRLIVPGAVVFVVLISSVLGVGATFLAFFDAVYPPWVSASLDGLLRTGEALGMQSMTTDTALCEIKRFNGVFRALTGVVGSVALIPFLPSARRGGDLLLDVAHHFRTERDDGGCTDYFGRRRVAARLRWVVNEIVADNPGLEHLILVAHSQGSIIALEALAGTDLASCPNDEHPEHRTLHIGDLPVTLITMGSPFAHLYQHYFADAYPALEHDRWARLADRSSIRWINVYRDDDFVGTDVGRHGSQRPGDVHRLPRGGHTGYWSDERFAEIVRKAIVAGGVGRGTGVGGEAGELWEDGEARG